MREIKFRCWNSFSNHMHDWNEMVDKNKIHLLSNENKSYVCEQFTGLTDKNGVEIYEGDVLTNEDFFDESCDMIVEMNDRGCFIARDKAQPIDFLYLDDLDFIVIGNIHQHQHLISNKQVC